MKQSFILRHGSDEISIRTIIGSDCEIIRQWKNENRFSFFFQDIITSQMQEKWYGEYLERVDDNMFVVQHENITIGCMGFRLIDKKADIYNVILGNPDYGRKGFMSMALALMCSYILSSPIQNISIKVLRTNPALDWYLKNGFCEALAHESFLELEFDIKRFEPFEFQKSFYYAT